MIIVFKSIDSDIFLYHDNVSKYDEIDYFYDFYLINMDYF